MLKRLLTIGAIAALPLAAACGSGSDAPAQGANPDQPASPVASDTKPAEPPVGQPMAPPPAQPASHPAGQPTSQAATGSRSATAPGAAPAGAPVETRNPAAKMVDSAPDFREVTIPAGTVLPVALETTVSSETATVEDPVRARLRKPVTIDGLEALSAGSTLSGVVTEVRRAGRVKGRAYVALRFNSLDAGDERVDIRTGTVARTAPATKKEDATKIGIGAGAGAVIGGIVGGGSGAAKGAAIGGAGGTGVVLATRGKDVSIPSGTSLSVKLTEPITVKVLTRR